MLASLFHISQLHPIKSDFQAFACDFFFLNQFLYHTFGSTFPGARRPVLSLAVEFVILVFIFVWFSVVVPNLNYFDGVFHLADTFSPSPVI
jgi:hypothetical protein